jgi:hypothetical protein
MATSFRSRVVRVAPPLLAGVLPALLLGIANAQFILNHFFVDAPYLLDSGFYSALVYHAGISPKNPNIALNFADNYFTFHFSPFIVLFSLLSYIQPLDRIEWYALFQAIVYLPTGIATYALARHVDREGLFRRLPITMFAALAFSFSGLVLTFIGYPHYEPAIPGFVCLVLVFVVVDRPRPAWLFLVVAASVREDAGFHTGLALMPLLYLRWRGTETGATRRQLVAMIGAAFAMSVAMIVFQKLFFDTHTLGSIYLGSPPFGHVTLSLIGDRAWIFATNCQHIYYPFLATCLVAALRRDARYLLGWVATVPWFLLNFLAFQQLKSSFFAYTGLPFIVSIFWVYLYGAKLAPESRRLRPGVIEALFALISVSSTLGVYRENPEATMAIVNEMAKPHHRHRAQVHGFAEAIGAHRASFGRLYVDYAVASLTLESVTYDNSWQPGMTSADSLAFHRGAAMSGIDTNDLIANQLDTCTHVLRTELFVCTRDRLPADTFAGIDTATFPAMFEFSDFDSSFIRSTDRGLVFLDGRVMSGHLGHLAAGNYELTLTLAVDEPLPPEIVELARFEIVHDKSILFATAPRDTHELVLRFGSDGGQDLHAYRFVSHAGVPLTVTSGKLRKLP